MSKYEGSSRIFKSQFLPNNEHEFLTASINGEIRIWDIRKNQNFTVTSDITDGTMLFDAHRAASLIVRYVIYNISGSTTQNIQISDLKGKHVSTLKYNEGFLARQVASLENIGFHPRQLSIVLNTGTLISIYRSDLKAIPDLLK